jgi:recA bacterial DNA recombination protein
MSLKERLIKNSTIDHTSILSESKIYGKKDMIPTAVPMINVALSGRIDGGLTPGLTVLAAPSKHFKTAFSLLMASAYLKRHPNGVVLFYDSEFGTPQSYFDSFGVPMESVIHTPITDIEQLKFDVMKQLDEIKRDDEVIIIIDSVGNLASKKEVEDALKQNSAADMSRAKQLKSLFRMVTPHLTLKDIPMIVVNHVYMEQSLYPKAIVSGGCLIENTNIRTLDGLKAIQEIEVGEIVYTLDGEKMVTHVWNPDTLEFGEPECYEIEFEDGYICTVSNQHPFLTSNGWIDAEDLQVNDEVYKI